MKNKYNPKDKFTAKESDFEIVYMPPKKQATEKKGAKAEGQKQTKKK